MPPPDDHLPGGVYSRGFAIVSGMLCDFHWMGENTVASITWNGYTLDYSGTSNVDGADGMDFNIPDKELDRIASDASFTGRYSKAIVAAYRQTLQILDAVPDESVLSEFKCLNYRKVRGPGFRRKLALTEEAELLVRVQGGKSRPTLVIEGICRNRRNGK